MTANIYEKMFYSFKEEAWHAIRKASQIAKSAVQIIKEDCFGAFTLENRPVTVTLNGVPTETGDFAIVRCASVANPSEVVFGYCSEKYHPLQPIQVAEIFDANVCQPAETLAFLGQGEDMFISWKMPDFDIVGDLYRLFGIVRTGFDTKHGTKLFTSIYRPVCKNTITMSEAWSKANTNKQANKGMIWTGKGVNRNLARDLGYWMEHVQTKAIVEADLIQSFFSRLAEKPIHNDDEAVDILFKAYPNKTDVSEFIPWQLRDESQKAIAQVNDTRNDIRENIFGLFSGGGTEIDPTHLGLLNATSEFFNHYQPSKKPIAESLMFGGRAENIMAMVETLNRVSK
jgi:hypothetical protein